MCYKPTIEIKYKTFSQFIEQIEKFARKDGYVFRGLSENFSDNFPALARDERSKEVKKIIDAYQKDYFHVMLDRSLESELSTYSLLDEIRIVYLCYKECNKRGLQLPTIDKFDFHIGDLFNSTELDKFFENSQFLEVLSLAQHYGIATRLLDWSYNFKVAVYFAISGAINAEKPNKGNYFSILQLNVKELKEKQPLVKSFTPNYKNNNNLRAQEGLFTFWEPTKGKNNELKMGSLEEIIDIIDYGKEIGDDKREPILTKYLIPYSEIPQATKYAKKYDLSKSRFFPDFSYMFESLQQSVEYKGAIN